MHTYLIIETYRPGKAPAIYQRFAEQGRMLPAGVEYINSWVEENLEKCYQIMRSTNRELLDVWIENWKDLVDFEVIPVLNSEEARNKIAT